MKDKKPHSQVAPLEYARQTTAGRKRPLVSRILFWMFLPIGLIFSLFVLISWLQGLAIERTGYQYKCAANLHNIGIACQAYANAHAGQYPDRFEVLLLDPSPLVHGEHFVCPNTNDTSCVGTSQQQAASLSAGGHCSYIYVGKGFTTNMPGAENTVVAYELPGHHDSKKGMNVLFADWHCEFVRVNSVTQLFAKYPPPAIPKTTPTTAL